MNRHDVRVGQPSRRSGFAQEPLAYFRIIGESLRKRLDGHEAIEADVAREVDDAHSAASDLALAVVLPGQRCLDVGRIGGGRSAHWHKDAGWTSPKLVAPADPGSMSA